MFEEIIKRWVAESDGIKRTTVIKDSSLVKDRITVKGDCLGVASRRWKKASVVLTFRPNDRFEIRSNLAIDPDYRCVEQVSFGVLDVILRREGAAPKNTLVNIDDVVIDPVETTAMAIRWAAEDAARSLIESLERGSRKGSRKEDKTL